MARPNQDAVDTFMNITGAPLSVALQKLEEHGSDLNEAVNAYFTEGDRNMVRPTSAPAPETDFMDIDNDPSQDEPTGLAPPLLSAARNLNPFSLLDPNFRRGFFEGRSTEELGSSAPYVSHPREVREIPIEFKDGGADQFSHSGSRPVIEDITGTASAHGHEVHGTVEIDDDEDEETLIVPSARVSRNERTDNFSDDIGRRTRPSAPEVGDVADYGNDIEEEMIRAAIEASKREVEEGHLNQQSGAPHSDLVGPQLQQREPVMEDAELARAVSLSIMTAEEEKAKREQGNLVETTEAGASDAEVGKTTANGSLQGRGSFNKGSSSSVKLEAGSSSVQDEAEDVEEKPLVRNRSRSDAIASGSVESLKEVGEMDESPPLSPGPRGNAGDPPHNGDIFSEEWGGISSVEHDEAVMLEAAIFGGIPEATPYNFAYPPHVGRYPRTVPRPPSPNLTAQRMLREQQDDEYLASLQADREKELKAIEEAEARRLEEQTAREAALEEERKKEEEIQRKLLEEEEFERKLAAKEASLPQEPASDDENVVNLLIRMPDGSRRGRRFLKSDKLQSLFDFIDVGRVVKPGSYRLVRPYPRRAFSDGESNLSLIDLGLTSKQEALFLESI